MFRFADRFLPLPVSRLHIGHGVENMIRFLIYLISIVVIVPTIACGARHTHSRGGISVSLETPGGQPLNTYYHRGKTFVLGEHGHRYVIRVRNRTAQRIETVISVDGRDVISGRSGNYGSQRGYVIGPYDTISVEGFRRSMNHVAAFRFTNRSDSYAGRMGAPQKYWSDWYCCLQ